MMSLIDEPKGLDEELESQKDEDELLRKLCLVYMKGSDEYLQR